jgi:MraZ protein
MGDSVKIDQKGRLKIPANLLTTLHLSDTEFYITSESGDFVRIYPMQVWNQVEERLERLCSRDRKNQNLLARAKYFGRAVTIDRRGRLLIPIVLRNSAQMKGAVDVLDYSNYLEVWNHDRFLRNMKSSPITARDEKTLKKLSSAPRFPRAIHRKERHDKGDMARFRMHRRLRQHSPGQAIHALRGAGTDPAKHTRVA